MAELLNLLDFEAAAAERLEPGALGYYTSGADDERTLRDNREAWARRRLLPRVMAGVGEPDLSTTVLHRHLDWPVLVAPMALQAMACPEGERATVRAAGRVGSPMILSTISNTSVEDVVSLAHGPVWFQLYVYRDRAATRDLVQRVEEAGCTALVLTVDAPHLGRREADLRNRFAMPAHLELPNVLDRGRAMTVAPARAASALADYAAEQLDPALTWTDVDWLCRLTRLPVLVKGVLHPEDAVRAADHGARGVIVSNHGGRQLDTSVATADALPAVVETLAGRADVLVDGGIRRGTDVLKALALGARAVLLGRPVLWGLAVGGEDGAARVLELLRTELLTALALSGCRTIDDVTPALVVPASRA
jgi:4-hydroxymandelate oxidase